MKFFSIGRGGRGSYLCLLGQSADAHPNRTIGRANDRGEGIHLLDGRRADARSLSDGGRVHGLLEEDEPELPAWRRPFVEAGNRPL